MFRCQWIRTPSKRLFSWIVPGLVAGLILPVLAGAEESKKTQAKDTEQKQVRQIRALRINPHAPKIDGKLDDVIWKKAEFFTKFTQKEPKEGEAALNETEIAIVYDDDALYVGARMYSKDPNKILATLTRRDNVSNSERILVSLDSYNDNRTAYTFGVTASGVRVDYYHGADYEGNRDYDFDPVWRAVAARSPEGWNAEMRIPFSQLRFNKKDVQTWGININRWVPTGNEDSYFVMIPKNETGWSSRMADLVGIEAIKPSRRIEVLPYVASDGMFRSGVDAADPFRDGEEYKARIGADFKMGVGPNLTLEGTVNPDFGQVEADPAEVNLSAFETFFSERRPFFTEGSNLLEGGGAGYFYSRRIGARPHGDPDGEFVDSPTNTSILGAAKLTGRLSSGLSVGVLGAVTEREKAKVFNSGKTIEEEVEPLTGFGVVRLQQEFGKDASTVGVILTGIERDLSDGTDLATFLRTRAIAGGTDWNLRFDGGKYELGGNVGFSHIEGSQSAIAEAQQSSARYFQRPDADHTEFDPTRTSLNGWTSDLWFEKNGGEHWLWGGFVGAESPGFEINDTGRLGTADDIDSQAWVRYRENDPGRHFQNWWTRVSLGSGWNFDSDRQYSFLDLESVFTFKNYMGSFLGYEYFPAAQSDNLTRGGPSMGTGESWNMWAELWSNNQKKTTWNMWGGYSEGETGSWSYNLGGGATFRPGDRWQLSFNPQWNQRVSSRQYIDTFAGNNPLTFNQRYLFSSIERSQLVAQIRLNYSFSPDLSLELYAEPFAASGRYFRFGELAAARSKDLRHYGAGGTSIVNNGDGTYTVTDGAQTFDFEQPDFNFLSFRSNLVMRWEWSPGSTVFLVWQQNRSTDNGSGSLVGPSGLFDALSAEGDNFIALKITYWLPFL